MSSNHASPIISVAPQGCWNKEFNCWTAPDESTWGSNALVNRSNTDRTHMLDCAMLFEHLKQFSFPVNTYDAPKENGRIRVLTMRPPGRFRCRMYHLDDQAEVRAIFEKHCKERRSAGQTTRWAKNEVISRKGEDWVRGSYVERELGISPSMRRYWDNNNLKAKAKRAKWAKAAQARKAQARKAQARKAQARKAQARKAQARKAQDKCGWALLDGNYPRTITEYGETYYAKVQIDGLKPKLEAIPLCIPLDHPTIYSEEKTAELFKLTINHLRHAALNAEYGLVKVDFLARIMTAQGRKLTWLVGYTKASVREALERKDARIRPQKTISVQAWAKRLKQLFPDRCTISPGHLTKWCREQLLDSQRAHILVTENAVRPSWIMAEESAADVKQVLRDCRWDSQAATIELRKLKDDARHIAAHKLMVEREIRRVLAKYGECKAATNGQPLPSLVAVRIEEQRLKAKKLAAERLAAEQLAQEETVGGPAAGAGAEAPDKTAPRDDAPDKERGRGRRPGRTDEVLERERRLIEAWDQQLYGNKKAAYAEAFEMQRSRVSAVICEYERRKKAYK